MRGQFNVSDPQMRYFFSKPLTRPDQTRPDQTRPDQTRPDQTRQDQTRPDQTRPDQTRFSKNILNRYKMSQFYKVDTTQ